MRPVGAHVSVGGGLRRALERAEERRCDALQVFPSNPRAWALPATAADDEAARAALEERGWPLFFHAPYLVNVASPDDTTWHRSGESLDFAMRRAERVGAAGVIVHAGHCVGAERRHALARAASALAVLLDRHDRVDLLVEPTAGGTGAVAGRPEEMAELLGALDGHPRLRFCLDTCHLWAAGVDYTTEAGLRAVRGELADLGPDRVAAVHLNDSKDTCGARRDRHQNLGRGEIGVGGIRRLVTSPELRHAPLLIETPGKAPDQRRDVELARSWLERDGSAEG